MKNEEEIKRWTAKRKSALVMDIIQGKTTVAEASRTHNLTPSEIENWVDDAMRGMENALRAKPEDVRKPYERQLRDLQEAYREAMLELRARKTRKRSINHALQPRCPHVRKRVHVVSDGTSTR